MVAAGLVTDAELAVADQILLGKYDPLLGSLAALSR